MGSQCPLTRKPDKLIAGGFPSDIHCDVLVISLLDLIGFYKQTTLHFIKVNVGYKLYTCYVFN